MLERDWSSKGVKQFEILEDGHKFVLHDVNEILSIKYKQYNHGNKKIEKADWRENANKIKKALIYEKNWEIQWVIDYKVQEIGCTL